MNIIQLIFMGSMIMIPLMFIVGVAILFSIFFFVIAKPKYKKSIFSKIDDNYLKQEFDKVVSENSANLKDVMPNLSRMKFIAPRILSLWFYKESRFMLVSSAMPKMSLKAYVPEGIGIFAVDVKKKLLLGGKISFRSKDCDIEAAIENSIISVKSAGQQIGYIDIPGQKVKDAQQRIIATFSSPALVVEGIGANIPVKFENGKSIEIYARQGLKNLLKDFANIFPSQYETIIDSLNSRDKSLILVLAIFNIIKYFG